MEIVIILLLELSVLGIIYSVLSFMEMKVVSDELKHFHKLKFIAIVIFVIGFIVHTLGDVLGGGTPLEMQMETLGHFIIMVGGVITIKQSLYLNKVAREFGYD